MINDLIGRLLAIASGPLLDGAPRSGAGDINLIAQELLSKRNGFYAFESALHVLPSGPVGSPAFSVEQWNVRELWLAAYGPLAPRAVFFAEDLFGGQFAIKDGRIYSFDPETAKFASLAGDLTSWCGEVMSRYDYLTGFSVGHEWQMQHGALRAGHRLVPRIPFSLGGDYSAANVEPVESGAALRYRARLATRISELPDSAQIRFSPEEIDAIKCDRGGVGDAPCRCIS